MSKKIKVFEESFINYQYKLIDELVKQQDRLDVNDRKEFSIYIMIEGTILNLMFRLKGIINVIKELNGEEIIVPEKYNKYYKAAKEMAYLKGEELIFVISSEEKEEEKNADEFINMIKAIKNGQTGKDKK